jgi:hypothetical protein
MPKTTKSQTPTTAQQLGSIVKSARDIMRKDKGLNGHLDRLPMLTWIMFLEFLDDMERIREEETILSGDRFRPAVELPYRWRDWAGNSLPAADANGSFTAGSSYQAWKGWSFADKKRPSPWLTFLVQRLLARTEREPAR